MTAAMKARLESVCKPGEPVHGRSVADYLQNIRQTLALGVLVSAAADLNADSETPIDEETIEHAREGLVDLLRAAHKDACALSFNLTGDVLSLHVDEEDTRRLTTTTKGGA